VQAVNDLPKVNRPYGTKRAEQLQIQNLKSKILRGVVEGSRKFILIACLYFATGAAGVDSPRLFVDATESSGLADLRSPREQFGMGTALLDYDQDGDLDLVVATASGAPWRLFENTGQGHFVDVTARSGLRQTPAGHAVIAGDYDNDGDLDLYTTSWGQGNFFYRHNGDGTFTEVTAEVGLSYRGFSTGAAWGDYDNDGYLDLVITDYWDGYYRPAMITLYHNNGDGTFANVTGIVGGGNDTGAEPLARKRISAFQPVFFDYNNDGFLDLFVSEDCFNPLICKGNILLRNNGNGTFTDVTVAAGAQAIMNGMGVAIGDYDNNGFLDFYVTNIEEGGRFFHNNGDGTFTERAVAAGVAVEQRVSWGCVFFDFDFDGDQDLFVAAEGFRSNAVGNVLLENNSDGTFADVSADAGLNQPTLSFGAAVGDVNSDVFPDVFFTSVTPYTNHLMLNNMVQHALGNNWLKIQLEGTVSNRSAIGARVEVVSGGKRQVQQVIAGSSYLSQNDLALTFGLGHNQQVEAITIYWPSGRVTRLTDVGANQSLVVRE
jgi:hypothetical protein